MSDKKKHKSDEEEDGLGYSKPLPYPTPRALSSDDDFDDDYYGTSAYDDFMNDSGGVSRRGYAGAYGNRSMGTYNRGGTGTSRGDWFGRDAKTHYSYTSNKNKYFGWESGLNNFSDFFSGGRGDISDIATLMQSMLRVIGVDVDKGSLAANGTSTTSKVAVPTHILQNESGNSLSFVSGEKKDAFYGGALLGGALKKFQTLSEYKDHITSVGKAHKGDLKSFLHGLINEERVHKDFSEVYPGYSKFIQKYKEYQFSKANDLDKTFENEFEEVIHLLTKKIRYPDEISEELQEKHKVLLDEVKHLFDKYDGIPKSAADTHKLTQELYDQILKYVIPPEEEQEENGCSKPGASGEAEGKLEKAIQELAKQMMIGAQESPGEGEKKMIDNLEKIYDENNNKFEKNENVRFITAPDSKRNYDHVKSCLDLTKAAVLRQLLARQNKDFKFTHKSMRSGRLDTNKLAEAVQRVSTIYERIGEVKTDKIMIGVLIDESGSMGGRKIEKAQQAAVFLNETFGKVPFAELFIYGHTADQYYDGGRDGATDIYIYKEPGKSSPFALGSVQSRSNNRDGVAIYHAARRIRKFTQNNGVLFVLSDGAPAASNYGGTDGGVKHTRDMVNKVEKEMGMQVVQIAIETMVPSEKMFKHFVKMTDIKNLPADMFQLFARKVTKMMNHRTTM